MSDFKIPADGSTLSQRAQDWLARHQRSDSLDTPERIVAFFVAAGLPTFPAVIDSFFRFGGYCLPMGVDGRFKFHRATLAIRGFGYRGNRSDNADEFRIAFGESETSQTAFTMDGQGRLYEDEQPYASSIVAWIEEHAAQRGS